MIGCPTNTASVYYTAHVTARPAYSSPSRNRSCGLWGGRSEPRAAEDSLCGAGAGRLARSRRLGPRRSRQRLCDILCKRCRSIVRAYAFRAEPARVQSARNRLAVFEPLGSPGDARPIHTALEQVCARGQGRTGKSAAGDLLRIRYGAMESGKIRARAIASTPNSARAVNPKFRRFRRIDAIEVSRRLMENDSFAPQPQGSIA
jgi:hypothetical protein